MTDNALEERLELVQERIQEIPEERKVNERLLPFFQREAEYVKNVLDWKELDPLSLTEEENRAWQERLFSELRDRYPESYCNPVYAEEQLGTCGRVLSFLVAELRGLPAYFADGFTLQAVAVTELFLEIYSLFQEEEHPHVSSLEKAVQFFALDYVESFEEHRLRDTLVPARNKAYRLVMESDLQDTRYLYGYGEYISENERVLAAYLNRLSEEEIREMAETFTRGFRRGYTVMRVDFRGKNAVSIRYHIGQERLVRAVCRSFSGMGLSPILHRYAVSRLNRRQVKLVGFESTPVNRQFIFDHRMDDALFLTPRYVTRKINAVERAYKRIKDYLPGYAGPAVIETFGEDLFSPAIREEAAAWSPEQTEMDRKILTETGLIAEKYLQGDSYSFSIIAFPLPEIGEIFEEVFRETIRLNTLSNEEYLPIQQRLIDVLDQADHVHVTGENGNRTDISVKLRRLEHPEKETQFENCVADVNIPLGEVFTSPVLKGTEGLLHVSTVYLNGYHFKDLCIRFRDGMTEEYSCGNFQDPEEGRKYIEANILFHHKALPMGEFAVGTNTAAYNMAKRLDIFHKLPILIMEKTGPHFAVGDTCYSHAEDTQVYNPDGKEIISRENDFSLLRETEPEKAYFNCHTDITIPYDELDRVTAVMESGEEVDLIRGGRFVVPGTEALNRFL